MSRYVDFHIRIGARRAGGAGPDDRVLPDLLEVLRQAAKVHCESARPDDGISPNLSGCFPIPSSIAGNIDPDNGVYPIEVHLKNGPVFKDVVRGLDLDVLRWIAWQYDPRLYGQFLARVIFSGRINDAYQKARGIVEARDVAESERYDGLRIRVSLAADAPELQGVVWELLYHPEQRGHKPLATTASHPFSRYDEMQCSDPVSIRSRSVSILVVVVADPSETSSEQRARIDASAEIQCFQDALADFPTRRAVQVTFMPGLSGLPNDQQQELVLSGHKIVDGPASLEAISKCLRRSFDVLHILCHGHFDYTTRAAGLFLENAKGERELVSDEKIVNALHGLRRPPGLIFLSACESATRADNDAFRGLAPRLVHAQIPAVVAMQGKVKLDQARMLTSHFYPNLLDHGLVDLAMNQARSLLYADHTLDWGIPALYMRLQDGCLFTLAKRPIVPKWAAFTLSILVSIAMVGAWVVQDQPLPSAPVPPPKSVDLNINPSASAPCMICLPNDLAEKCKWILKKEGGTSKMHHSSRLCLNAPSNTGTISANCDGHPYAGTYNCQEWKASLELR